MKNTLTLVCDVADIGAMLQQNRCPLCTLPIGGTIPCPICRIFEAGHRRGRDTAVRYQHCSDCGPGLCEEGCPCTICPA